MRIYYRVWADSKSYIVMDCPPEHPSYANIQSFISVLLRQRSNKFLLEKDFSAPRIIEQDIVASLGLPDGHKS